MAPIVFASRLTDADWDDITRGWRCPALNIPGAIVKDIVVDGNREDKDHYTILTDQAFIHWVLPTKPERIAAIIELTEPLSLVSDTDKWKNDTEKWKSDTEKWKKLAIVLPVLATILAAAISGGATYFSRSTPPAAVVKEKTVDLVKKGPLVSSNTEFILSMPRGDKVCLNWKEQPSDGSGEEVLKTAGISIFDYNEGTRLAYAALTKRSSDTINYVPYFHDGKPTAGFCQAVVVPGPAQDAGYEEFQLFQYQLLPNVSEMVFYFIPLLQTLPPVPPEKIGVDWDKVRAGLRGAFRALYKNRDFELRGIDVLTKADGFWEYRMRVRRL
jgi:hypothetical protein